MGIKVDFTGVKEPGEFTPIPAGEYVMTCAEVHTKDEHGADLQTKDHDPMWRLILAVDPPSEFAGRKVFDQMIFGGKQALRSRLKLICSRLAGKKTDGALEIEPSDFVGKRARVSVIVDEYNGTKNNKVSFAGYDHLDAPPKDGAGSETSSTSSTPF